MLNLKVIVLGELVPILPGELNLEDGKLAVLPLDYAVYVSYGSRVFYASPSSGLMNG